jgi:exodeoxyribonuclease V gamma subunit
LEGELSLFRGVGLVHCRPAKARPAAHLRLWIEHLVLQLAGLPENKTSRLIAEDGIWIFNEVPDAEKILQQLLQLYFLGLTRPLPFFPETAFAFAAEPGPRTKKITIELAREKWEGGENEDFGKAEAQDPYYNLCFRNAANPLDEEFKKLARQIVAPLLAHQVEKDLP